MKCPVCKTDTKNMVCCLQCGFNQINRDFISVEDAENWKHSIVEPYARNWRKDALENYFRNAGIEHEVRALKEAVSNNSKQHKCILKLINRFYKLLIEPTEPLTSDIAQALIEQCLYYISSVTFSGNSISERIRKIKLQYTHAILLLMSGNLCGAYDLFCEIASNIDDLYQCSDRLYSDAVVVYFYAEAVIHQIKVLAGIDDEDFFFVDREEIRFHQNFSNYKFEDDDFLYIFNYTPRFSMSDNPYYEVFDSNGKYFQCMGKNINWLSVKRNTNTEYLVKYRFWELTCNNVDFCALVDHINNSPYCKMNKYLHDAMTCYNQNH